MCRRSLQSLCEDQIVNPVNNRRRLQSSCALAAWLAVCVSAQGLEPEEIQADIDHLLSGLGGRVNLQERIDRVAKHGTNAVPVLIETYSRSEPEKRWPLAACLCQIPNAESVDFLKTILRSHEDRRAASEVIRRFPLEYEDQITLLSVDLLGAAHLSFDAEERLRKMIFRKPSRAGDLVRAMGTSDKTMTGMNWQIGEILAHVSGYSHTWCCLGPSSTDWGAWQQEFWTGWWKRNKDKEPFDWLVETWRSDPGNDARRAEALQILGSLNDPRSAAFFLEELEAESERVRYWAVVGLQQLDGTFNPGGYQWETFQQEQAQVIKHLKQKFSSQRHHVDRAQQGAPPNVGPATSPGNSNLSGGGRHR